MKISGIFIGTGHRPVTTARCLFAAWFNCRDFGEIGWEIVCGKVFDSHFERAAEVIQNEALHIRLVATRPRARQFSVRLA